MFINLVSPDGRTTVSVELEEITDSEYLEIQEHFKHLLTVERQKSGAIAKGFIYGVMLCPKANPSDIWQHIIYRTYLAEGYNDQSWKRASGDGFQFALRDIYNPHLVPYGIRLVVLTTTSALKALKEMDLIGKVPASKIDVAIEGDCTGKGDWKIFGVIHLKSSIAERINDDAPASREIIKKGFVSLAVTLDSKSFPPPHGNGINYGELGGRTIGKGLKDEQQKRNYVEVDGDFTHMYSYNLRTPCSPGPTQSGSRIKTLCFTQDQPDEFVVDLCDFWKKLQGNICNTMPITSVK